MGSLSGDRTRTSHSLTYHLVWDSCIRLSIQSCFICGPMVVSAFGDMVRFFRLEFDLPHLLEGKLWLPYRLLAKDGRS